MSNRVIYNVEYNIPRVNIQFPGRQNRSNEAELRFTPGLTEVVEFWFGNHDGVPINLVPFELKWVFWKMNTMDHDELSLGQSDIILVKKIPVAEDQRYSGKALAVLEADDTLKLAAPGSRSVRWGVFMLNQEGQVFPAQVNRNGDRWATAVLDIESGIPIAEVIRSAG